MSLLNHAYHPVIQEAPRRNFDSHGRVSYKYYIYFQVFWPSERLDNSTILHLVYCQVVQDVFNNACVRISKEQRIKMRSMLGECGENTHFSDGEQ